MRFADTVPVLPISPKMPIYSGSDGLTSIAMSSSGFSGPIIPPGWSVPSGIFDALSGPASAASGTEQPDSQYVADPINKPFGETLSLEGQAESGDSDSDCGENGTDAHSNSVLLDVPKHLLRRVRRGDLTPLDEDLIDAKYAHLPESDPYRHFLLAMLSFPEWDYPQQNSYIWPDFALGVMQNLAAQEVYIRTALTHPLNNGARPFADVILFLLCAEHTGVLDEWDDDLYTQHQQCTDGVQFLLESISAFRATDEDIFRATCRVADCFQATSVPALRDQRDPSDLAEETAVHSAEMISADRLEEYLSQVQALRETYLRINQLVEAPLNPDQFGREWEAYRKKCARACQSATPTTAIPSKHATRQTLDAFIATSRRENKKLTALFTVKQPVCPAFPAPFSPPAPPKTVAIVTASGSKNQITDSSSSSSSAIKTQQGTAPASDAVDGVERLIPTSGRAALPELKVPAEVTETSDTSAMEVADSTSEIGVAVPVVSPVPPNHKVTATALPERAEDFVVLNFGTQEHRVPLRFCRIPTLPEDIALEVLYACGNDVPRALAVVAEKLHVDAFVDAGGAEVIKREPGARYEGLDRVFCKDSDITLNRRIISTVELDQYHGVVNR